MSIFLNSGTMTNVRSFFFFFFKQKTAYEIGLGIPAEPLFRSRLSLQTHNVNRCGRSRHLARKLSLRRKRSSPNVFEMARSEERRVGKECRSRRSRSQ